MALSFKLIISLHVMAWPNPTEIACVYLDEEKVIGVIHIFIDPTVNKLFFSFLRIQVIWLTGGEDVSVSFLLLYVSLLQLGFDKQHLWHELHRQI